MGWASATSMHGEVDIVVDDVKMGLFLLLSNSDSTSSSSSSDENASDPISSSITVKCNKLIE